MRRSKLIRHYNRKLATFSRYFTRTAKRHKPDDIHQLRVTIKKLRALLTLVEISGDKVYSKKDHITLLSKLFRTAGNAREAQVNYSMIEKRKASYLQAYANYLLKLQQQHTRKLITETKAFDTMKFEALNAALLEKMSRISDQRIAKEAAAYILLELKKIRKQADKHPNDHRLHKIRKHLKAVSEIVTLLHELNPTLKPDKLHHTVNSLNKKIGKWHDNKVLIDSLKNFSLRNKEEIKTEHLKKFIRRIKYRNDDARRKAYKLLRKYIAQEKL